MSERQHDNHDHIPDPLLDDLLATIRTDEPTEEQYATAQSRLMDRLAGERQALAKSQTAAENSGLMLATPDHARLAGLRQFLYRLWFQPRVRVVGLSVSLAALLAIIAIPVLISLLSTPQSFAQQLSTPGELRILGKDGETAGLCPLQHTDVEADVTGFISRVRVRQQFQNSSSGRIEAVYVFPLPEGAAVDEMTMLIGQRRIVGRIMPRPEARQAYEQAKAAGQHAALLDQERPNIFTQSVAIIDPGAAITIEISYVQTLKYEDGAFSFVFPMVVAPRYNPGAPLASNAQSGSGLTSDTTQVSDASRISPPVVPPATRAGHDISLTVHLDAGLAINEVKSDLHEVNIERPAPTRATITLKNQGEIPNRDFVLHYATATEHIGDALLLHQDERGAFFTLILEPPRWVAPQDILPKEMIFVIDASGSMQGFPIEKAKALMRRCIERCNPEDTFNLLSFSSGLGRCFDAPRPFNDDNKTQAFKYLDGLGGGGGTEMMPAINEALGGAHDANRVRIVCFMTDGEIGNDFDIIDAVKKNVGASRVFAYGIGNSVNRFLIENIATAGRGHDEVVTLPADADAAADRFFVRMNAPVLTDISIDWGELKAEYIYPAPIPDLFSSSPIMIHGRLNGGPTAGAITLRGRTAAGPFERRIPLVPAAPARDSSVLATIWARARVDALMHEDLAALQKNQFPDTLKKQITDLGVAYHLMTQFTSFVAVEADPARKPAPTQKINVPLDLAEGMSPENATAKKGYISYNYTGGKKVQRVKSDERVLATALEAYYVDNNAYAANEPVNAGRQAASVDGKLEKKSPGIAPGMMAPAIANVPAPIVGGATTGSGSTPYVFGDAIKLGDNAVNETVPQKQNETVKWSYAVGDGEVKYQINGSDPIPAGTPTTVLYNRNELIKRTYDPSNGTTTNGDVWLTRDDAYKSPTGNAPTAVRNITLQQVAAPSASAASAVPAAPLGGWFIAKYASKNADKSANRAIVKVFHFDGATTGQTFQIMPDPKVIPRNPTDGSPLHLLEVNPEEFKDKFAQSPQSGEARIIIGDMTVSIHNYKITLWLTVKDFSPETLAALSKVGFETIGRVAKEKWLVGRLDVRKIYDLPGEVTKIKVIGDPAITPAPVLKP